MRGRKPYPRWDVKPQDNSHPGILIAAPSGEEAIEKARVSMKSKGWGNPQFLLTATERYNY